MAALISWYRSGLSFATFVLQTKKSAEEFMSTLS